MNLLITGGLGHIGTFLLSNSHKLKNVNKIFVIDKLNEKMLGLINLNIKKKINFINQDISRNSIILNKKKINVVIHLASITNAAASIKNKTEVKRNNLSCFRNVVNFCKKKKICLVHISSTSIYGSQKLHVDEECKELLPQSPYADVKIKEEKMLKKTNKNFKFISLRFGTIVGPSSGMRFHTAVNKFCMQAYLNKPLEVWKTARHQFRPYLSLNDAFKTFKFILKKKLFDREIYNIVSKNLTVNDIIKFINKHKKTKIKLVNEKIMNQLSYKVDSSKIKKIGLYLNSDLKIDIKDTFELLEKKSIYEKSDL